MNLSTSDVIAVAAVLTAIFSLFATIWQAKISRDHNKLSVRPILKFTRGRTFEERFITLRYSIKNDGFGPAIVKEQFFTLNGDVVPHLPGSDYVRDVVDQALGGRFHYVLRHHGLPGVGSAIPAQGECVIIEIEFPGISEQALEVVEATDIKFSLRYESLYLEQKMLTS